MSWRVTASVAIRSAAGAYRHGFSVTAHYPPVQAEKIRTTFADRARVEAMPVNEFVSMLVRN